MHSCEFRVKDEWMKHYRSTLKHFVLQLSQDVPHMSTVGQQIEDVSVFVFLCRICPLLDTYFVVLKRFVRLLFLFVQMLTVDLSICVFGVDRMDSAGSDSDADSQLEASAELVGQWEAELLQEMLQECLCVEDGVDSEAQVGGTRRLNRTSQKTRV